MQKLATKSGALLEKYLVSFMGFTSVISAQNRLFVCNRGDTIQYHGSLRSRELGQAPMLLVFLTQAGVIISPASTDGLTVLATG